MSDTNPYYKDWTNTESPKAAVVLVHGLGEHCHRYQALATHLNENDIALCAMDLPGHGKTHGVRGHIDSFDDFQDAVLTLLANTKKQFPQSPLFLLGHSMGGLIASKLLISSQDEFTGAMLSGAAIQSPQEPPAWQQTLIKCIAKIFPKAKMLALDASKVSRDKEVVKNYYSDPLISHEKLSAQFLISMMTAMNEVKDNAKRIKLPLLIMHGTADVMTAPAGSQWLYENVSSTDKLLKMYEGLYHEIFNEPEGPEIFTEMTNWIEQQLSLA